LLGVFKEIDDSRSGSGFSFADLAADHAGVKLAEIAVGSSRQAKILQQRMSTVIRETEYMPRVDHLPEGIMESRLYVNGTIRSWIHYIELRSGHGTQKEHIELARACADALEPVFPMIKEFCN